MTRVLIVEDEPIIAFDLAGQLRDAGYTVVGPALNVASSLELIAREGCDLAVLDINLGGETAEPVALKLASCNVPFVIMSGYSSAQHAPVYREAPSLAKPVEIEKLDAVLRRLSRSA